MNGQRDRWFDINGLTNEFPDIEMDRLRNKSMEYNITPVSGQITFQWSQISKPGDLEAENCYLVTCNN